MSSSSSDWSAEAGNFYLLLLQNAPRFICKHHETNMVSSSRWSNRPVKASSSFSLSGPTSTSCSNMTTSAVSVTPLCPVLLSLLTQNSGSPLTQSSPQILHSYIWSVLITLQVRRIYSWVFPRLLAVETTNHMCDQLRKTGNMCREIQRSASFGISKMHPVMP